MAKSQDADAVAEAAGRLLRSRLHASHHWRLWATRR